MLVSGRRGWLSMWSSDFFAISENVLLVALWQWMGNAMLGMALLWLWIGVYLLN
jgi:hypothetical protein